MRILPKERKEIMGVFQKLFGKKESTVGEGNQAEKLPILMLVFNQLPIVNPETIIDRISNIESLTSEVTVNMKNGINTGEALMAEIEFDKHRVNLVGFNAPVPKETVDYTVGLSHWRQDQKEKMVNHKAHILCYYTGDSEAAIERYIALYKVAYSFSGKNLLGVLNETAWTCQPSEVIEDIITPQMLEANRESVPLLFWTGFVKWEQQNGICFFTRGNHLFGVKDFAFFAKDDLEAENVFDIFSNIFYYLFETKAKIEVGHTLQIEEETFLRFKEMPSGMELLESPIETLVVEKIPRCEINA